jgi:hypothetical protein
VKPDGLRRAVDQAHAALEAIESTDPGTAAHAAALEQFAAAVRALQALRVEAPAR